MHSLIILINNVKHCNICHGLFSNLPLLFHNFIYNNLMLPGYVLQEGNNLLQL